MARKSNGPWFWNAKNGWYVWHEGKRHNLKVKGEGNEQLAVKAWHRLMGGVNDNDMSLPEPKQEAKPKGKPEPTPKVEANRLTVKELAEAYIADAKSRLKPKTIKLYRGETDRLCETFGSIEGDTLTAQALTLWLSKLDLSGSSKSITLRAVSAFLQWCVKADLLAVNVAKKVPKPKSRSRSAEAVISEADHKKLLEAASHDFRIVLQVLHATGCRPGEVCGITAENFDAENGVCRVIEHKTDYTGRDRLIFFPDHICEVLKAQAKEYPTGPLLRSNKGMAWTGRNITQAMRRLKAQVGVKAIAYGYRHTFATSALVKGVPDAHVAALLGHSSTAMIHRHYSHLGQQAQTLRNALAKVRA